MPVWPGDGEVSFVRREQEGIAKQTTLTLSAHTGSHVDGPAHLIPGASGVDCLELTKLMGMARVCQLEDTRIIDRSMLESLELEGVTRLLIGRGGSGSRAQRGTQGDGVHLTPEAAQYLVARGILLVAVDSLSVDGCDTQTYPVHRILLTANVVVVEGVDLTGVPAGDYELICLPLKIAGGDGAPARVVLRAL
ncbi:MAG: cyclase family protein [Dehalococcoidia bacterium]|nr:cyclase family protein [Dehalococcoidia bacterium]